MQKDSDLEFGRLQVAPNLTSRGFVKLVRRLDFNDEFFIYNHVESLIPKVDTLVEDWDTNLTSYAVATSQQFSLERHDVDVLEKTESKNVVDLEEGSNDGMRELFQDQSLWTHLPNIDR
jgi:hypothetical protein